MEGSLFWETVPLNAELLHHFSRIAVCSAEWWWWVEGRLCSTLPLRQPEPSILEVSHSPECGPSLSRSLEEEKESIENVLHGKGRSNHFLLAELSHMITSGCNLFVSTVSISAQEEGYFLFLHHLVLCTLALFSSHLFKQWSATLICTT